jgi:hypothetical protein
MKMLQLFTIAMATVLAHLCFQSSASAQAMSGSVNQDGWTFNWSATSTSGLRITNVRKNGVVFLYDGSMPAIRVQYDGNCGPYTDRIKWDNILADGMGNKVRSSVNPYWIRVWVESQIASYHLTQSWYFERAGSRVVSELQSSGLQCTLDHRHHPYWRYDFDIAGSGNNSIKTGVGGVTTTRTTEFNTSKSFSGKVVGFYNNGIPSKYVHLIPGDYDGTPDTFAGWDHAGRRYPSQQNDPWGPTFPDYVDTGDLESATHPSTSNNGEAINGQDIVFWYNAHLVHAASAGPTQVGISGNILQLFGY